MGKTPHVLLILGRKIDVEHSDINARADWLKEERVFSSQTDLSQTPKNSPRELFYFSTRKQAAGRIWLTRCFQILVVT